jgi:hypothetical protein
VKRCFVIEEPMTQLDDDEALFLAQARTGLSPTSADEQRVLQGVRAQIALGLAPQNTLNAPNVGSGGVLPKSPWPLRIVGSIAVIGAVALSGGLGYRQGWEAGIAQKNQPDPHENTNPSAPAARLDSALAPAAPIAPAPSVVHAAPSERERRAEREAKSSSVSSATRAPSALPAASASTAPPAPLGLDEEVRQLRRVERAIREGNPRFALVLLEGMDQAMPTGQLLEERRAASIMANCQLGSDDAVSNARAFVAKHAGSAYLSRVVAICGLESERNSGAPGTNTPRSGG